LYDGVSLPLLIQQLRSLCSGAKISGSNNRLDKYIAVAHAAPARSQRKAFWTQYLKNVAPHHNTKAEVASKSKIEIFKPSLLHTSDLETTARHHGISTQALFLAAYAKLHAMRSDRASGDNAIIGIYLANRSLPIDNLATAAIPTVNLLPLRVRSPLKTTILDIATRIQNDLQKISEPVNTTASLYEISEWTGVRVDVFVNFLSLPGTKDEDGGQCKDGVRITQKDGWREAVSRVTKIDKGDWEVPPDMMDERVNAAYLVSLQIST
jgi:hypothetical protein